MSGKDFEFAVVHALPHHKLSDALLRIVDHLYYDGEKRKYDPNKEWTQDTLEEVDRVLQQNGLRPHKVYQANYQNLPQTAQVVRFMVVFDGYHPKVVEEKVPPSFVCNDDRVEWFLVHRFSSPAYRKKHGINLQGPCWITSTAVSGLTGTKR